MVKPGCISIRASEPGCNGYVDVCFPISRQRVSARDAVNFLSGAGLDLRTVEPRTSSRSC